MPRTTTDDVDDQSESRPGPDSTAADDLACAGLAAAYLPAESRPDLDSPLFDPPLDADEIADRLWQGAMPPTGPRVRRAGFDVLVLCSEEYQPAPALFPGVRVIHAPNEDAPSLSDVQWQTVLGASVGVAEAIREGAKVLVTCTAGLNRSGLVSALTLIHLAEGTVSASEVVAQIQGRREMALCNDAFVELIHAYVSRVAGTP
jgi:hypothetical protein